MKARSAARISPLRIDDDPEPIRDPPSNEEAEQALLGALLIKNAAYPRVSGFLKPEHFYRTVHGRIYAAIGKLVDRGQTADPVTLKSLFDQDGALSEIGGAQYLLHLAGAAVTIINAEDYGRAIHDVHLRRQLIELGQALVDDAFCEDLNRPPIQIFESFSRRLTDLGDGAAPQRNDGGLALVAYTDMLPLLDGRPLIRGLIEREQLSVIYGEAGTGKTFLALDLALHVGAGLEWFGRRVAQGSVVYVAAEAGASIANRVAAWRQASGIPEVPFAAITSPIDLCHPDAGDIERLIAAIRAVGRTDPALTVIDTVSRVLAGGNENAPDDMGALVRSFDRLRDKLHCHVLAVHHSGKDAGRGSRGHSLLHCAVDTEIEVTRDDASGISTAMITKQRDGAAGAAIPFQLRRVDLGPDLDGEEVTSCVVEPTAEGVTAPARRKPLPPSQRRALDLLGEAISTAGEVPPACTHIPGATPCVSETLWRRYCYEGSLSSGGERAKQLAFQRASRELLAIKRIGVWGDWVWKL